MEYQENPSSSLIFEDQRVAAIDKKKKALELYNKNDAERLEAYALKQGLDKEVIDVRNWLKFKAVEDHREDPGKIFRSYTGTAKLSGGEGAQLTYTILGSAIAYQFGIHSEGMNTNSFRFICVDEAFSKQDDEKLSSSWNCVSSFIFNSWLFPQQKQKR